MFDFGFSELLVIGVVALVVLGPERLPVVARVAGKYFSKARRVINQVKEDIELEAEMSEFKDLEKRARSIAEEVSDSVRGGIDSVKSEVDSIRQEVAFSDRTLRPQENTAELPTKAVSFTDDFGSVHPVKAESFSRRYREEPDVAEIAEQLEQIKRGLGDASPVLTPGRRRHYAVRSRVSRVRIYR